MVTTQQSVLKDSTIARVIRLFSCGQNMVNMVKMVTRFDALQENQ